MRNASSSDYLRKGFGTRVTQRKAGRPGVPKPLAKEIAQRLRQALGDHDVSREEFARRLGYNVSRPSHSKRITNLWAGRLDTVEVIEICKTFRISADYLLLGKEPRLFDGLTRGQRTAVNKAFRTAMTADLAARDLDPSFIDEQIPKDSFKALREFILDRIKWETAASVAGLPSMDVQVVLLKRRRPRRVKSAVAESSRPGKGTDVAIAKRRKQLANEKLVDVGQAAGESPAAGH